MKGLLLLIFHFVAVLARLLERGGVCGLVAENLLIKHQLLVLSRARRRDPNLLPMERCFLGLCTLVVRPGRFPKVVVAVKASTLLKFVIGNAKDSSWRLDLFYCESIMLRTHWS